MTPKKPKYSIICNDSYGIYFGIVKKFNPLTGVAIVDECRHVARWYGREGGITSLAQYGICGSDAASSRIGGAVATATLTKIKNIFACSEEGAALIIGAGK